jgi:hypothetical protein
MKKKKKNSATCRYCLEFYNSKQREKEIVGNSTIYKRFCTHTNRYVCSHDKICEHFTIAPLFWCDIYGYWMSYEGCKLRIEKGYCNKKCRLYKILEKEI